MRISVVGVSCSGKSTLARRIAKRFSIPHIEQDYLFWEPNWQLVPKETFQKNVAEKITSDSWVICGNHRETRDPILDRATHIIWLNYSPWIIGWRALKRTTTHVFTKKECCNGNYETFVHGFLSKNSIFYWIIKTYRMRQQRYREEKELARQKGIAFFEIRHPRQVQNLLDTLGNVV